MRILSLCFFVYPYGLQLQKYVDDSRRVPEIGKEQRYSGSIECVPIRCTKYNNPEIGLRELGYNGERYIPR